MGRYKQNVNELPRLRFVELSFSKMVVIIATVMLTFVLPVYVISSHQAEEERKATIAREIGVNLNEKEGQVAGISTTSQENILDLDFADIQLDLNSESGILMMIGVVLIGVGIILVMFLMIDNRRYKKN